MPQMAFMLPHLSWREDARWLFSFAIAHLDAAVVNFGPPVPILTEFLFQKVFKGI